jgi:DNA-binding MarR family transcriptional regulator
MPHAELRTLLSDLMQANSRLVRIAAQTTGSTESPAVWRTLGVLRSHGAQRIGELAALSRVAQPTMTKLVAGLAERGWVERIPDVHDARAWQIAITDAGREASDAWRVQLADALYPYFSDLDDDDIAALRRAVRVLKERVDLNDTNPVEVGS